MKRPAVFFDRDNTLIISDGYLFDPSKVALIKGAADAIVRARQLGFATVVISNQSGVARGMFSEEDVQAVNTRMDELLVAENPQAIIDRHEFCPFHPDGTVDVYARESDRRKPKPGMLHSAAEKLGLELSRSWVIGDAPRDIEAGKAAGCRAILFTDGSIKQSVTAQEPVKIPPDHVVSTLAEALDFIERDAKPNAAVPAISQAETPPPPVQAAASARVPKVAIGSKYVPPAGKEAATATGRDDTPPFSPPRKGVRRSEDEPARPAAPPPTGSERMESLLEQIFLELRRQHEHQDADFSVSKLLAGVVQVIVLAILFIAYLRRDGGGLPNYLMLAMVLQTLTISLLIMSRQR